jgi:hypothetical protein
MHKRVIGNAYYYLIIKSEKLFKFKFKFFPSGYAITPKEVATQKRCYCMMDLCNVILDICIESCPECVSVADSGSTFSKRKGYNPLAEPIAESEPRRFQEHRPFQNRTVNIQELRAMGFLYDAGCGNCIIGMRSSSPS